MGILLDKRRAKLGANARSWRMRDRPRELQREHVRLKDEHYGDKQEM